MRDAWEALLPVFERCVLHTHRSKFTQFLLFYVATQEPQHCRWAGAQRPCVRRRSLLVPLFVRRLRGLA